MANRTMTTDSNPGIQKPIPTPAQAFTVDVSQHPDPKYATQKNITSSVKGKKKARYSRAEKRRLKAQKEEALARSSTQNSMQSLENGASPKQTQKGSKKKPCLYDRMQQCIRIAQVTQSVTVESPPAAEHPGCASDKDVACCSFRVISGSNYNESSRQYPTLNASHLRPVYTVRIQPLLILDINGILCHRSRSHREPLGVQLRPHIGVAAGTPVVPRTDLLEFLLSLQEHFCLAIWTSAKAKTARVLLKLLVPPEISSQFLFVWGQDKCDRVSPSNGVIDGDTIFQKRLDKVWRTFPLWNANNTLMMDDSPDKCPFAVANTVHPPPIHGQCGPPATLNNAVGHDCSTISPSSPSMEETTWIPDEDNQRKQSEFFHRYKEFWARHPIESVLTANNAASPSPVTSGDSEKSTLIPLSENIENRKFVEFLSHHGGVHMGWRGG